MSQKLNDERSRCRKASNLRIDIIGGGLVGALNACFLGNRGCQVNLYESRPDIRLMEHVKGRSINLALSIRGRSALRAVGLENEVIERHAIPMRARLIHDLNGRRRPIPYGRKDQCIFSVGRRFLNEILLTSAEKNRNVKIHFSHKLKSYDLDTGAAILSGPHGEVRTDPPDLLIGCDGAYSAVRRQMLKKPRFNYSQTYIPHGYIELTIPPTEEDQFAMEVNFLHIWPRGKFMMIALPNQDKSYTVTLFMQFEIFESLSTPRKLLEFFGTHFPDAIPLIGEEKLVKDFFNSTPAPLISIKCSPYHHGQNILVIGDAAHAMVPFYGQGMNAGFEDCLILDELMDKHDNDIGKVLPEFSAYRNPDAEAICDLAMYNYIEMRDLVNSTSFLLRKKLDIALNTIFPRTWIPLYSMVTFSRTRYHECIKKRAWQDKILRRVFWTLGITSSAVILQATVRFLATRELNRIDLNSLLTRFWNSP